ncbi:cyclic phosphodiesterase-like [Chenopodium quinoa]|uniref:RNA ligase/cyclic nucleotide phosphodiesterase family protein n=1 Tax=Chenopodium quinoa TaxID=63459 RepID=A0A803MDW4_CHEQI|nr:cyclic phosphodiesterase-like [Chenopodium quinoa]
MATQTEVYSVWGLPSEDVKQRVKNVMNTLRSEFNGPDFDPHVTIVGAITLNPEDAVDKFKLACKGLKAYTAHGRGVSTGTFFYQCVYLLLDTTPQVVETSDHCCGHFGYNRTAPYMPHMSLLYADLTDEEKKIAQERANALDDTLGNLSFKINRLALYKTDTEDKTLKSWEKVMEYDLDEEV